MRIHNDIINEDKTSTPDSRIIVLPPLWGRGRMRWHDSQFQTSNIQICICGSVNLHRYCAVQRARGNSANYYSTSPSGILLSPEIACAPVRRSSGIKGRIMSSPVVFWSSIFRRFVSERRSKPTSLWAGNKGKGRISRGAPLRKEMLKELDLYLSLDGKATKRSHPMKPGLAVL